MNPLGFKFRQLQGWLDQRAPRERAVLLLATAGLIVYAFIMLVIVPQQAEQQQLRDKATAVKEQTSQLRRQLKELELTYGESIDESGPARVEALRAKLAAMDPALAEVARSLVSPREMADLVEQVLRENRALEVISIVNLPVTPLGDAPPPVLGATPPAETGEPAKDDAGSGFYKHGMVIEVRGRYADIVGYLQSVEKLKWKLFWGQATLLAEDYPKSRIRLVVYTLSLNPKWIGI